MTMADENDDDDDDYPPPPLRSSHLSQGDSQYTVVTDSSPCRGIEGGAVLPLRQGRVPRRGEGVDKPSAPSCRNEVCDSSSASVK